MHAFQTTRHLLHVCSLVVVVALLCTTRSAHAGNDEEMLVGNEAALTGGAVAATISDGTALWHNPAGLATVDRDKLDVSTSAFVVRFYSMPNLITTPTESASGSTSEFVTVPTALSYVRRLSDRTRLGLGIFVPQSNDVIIRAQTDPRAMGTLSDQWVFNVSRQSSLSYFSAGIGYKASDKLTLGFSTYVLYNSEYQATQFSGGTQDRSQNTDFFTSLDISSVKTLALQGGAGLQWQASPKLRLGLMLRSPALRMYRKAWNSSLSTSSFSDAASSTQATTYTPDITERSGVKGGVLLPLQVRGALAYQFSGGYLSVDGDLRPALNSTEDDIDSRRFNWNVRVGGKFYLNETMSVGGGFFTDRNPDKIADGRAPVNFYGLAGGVELRTPIALNEEGKNLIFSTTIGGRYAYGSGDFASLSVPGKVSDVPTQSLSIEKTQIHVHELALLLGSSLHF